MGYLSQKFLSIPVIANFKVQHHTVKTQISYVEVFSYPKKWTKMEEIYHLYKVTKPNLTQIKS